MNQTPDRTAAPGHTLPVPCGAHIVARALQRHGVELMFGQSLPSALYLVTPEFGIRQIAYREENAGAAMADGYARASGRVAVVTSQNGPAAALLVAGLAEALKASIPVVALVQDVRRTQTDKNAFQDLDHPELFRACSKWVRRVPQLSRIDDYIDMAFTVAASGRPGPAVLMLPQDLLVEAAGALGASTRRDNLGRYPLDRTLADPAKIAQAALLLATARNPLIVAGGGVHISGAQAELAQLQEAAGIPVATTVMGKGAVDEQHPLSAGVIGYFMGAGSRTQQLRALIDSADVVLFVGDRTNQNGTDSWTLFPATARYIHIDIDSQEIGRNYEALRLNGDAKLTLATLGRAVAGIDQATRRAARPGVEQMIAAAHQRAAAAAAPRLHSDAVPIRPERLMHELDAVLSDDAVVVSDASYAPIWCANYLRARRPGMRFLAGRGLAGLGWGFPAALGAKLAMPDAPVFCVTGDGGFAHVWAELESAKRLGIVVTVIVLNNQILGYQQHAEEVQYGAHTDACALSPVDHAAIARACGCAGERIEQPGDFAAALLRAMNAAVTTVLDVMNDPLAYPPLTLYEGKLDY